MAIQQPSEPVSVRTGVLTPSEFAALSPSDAHWVEDLVGAMDKAHDAAWFAQHRDDIRENFQSFSGIPLTSE